MRLLPREEKFYHLFLKQVEIISEASRLLLEAVRAGNARLAVAATEINVLEHRGDEVIHELFTRLNQTFITPIDPEDIHNLSSALDTVLDGVEETAHRMVSYRIHPIPPTMIELSEIVASCARALKAAFGRAPVRAASKVDLPALGSPTKPMSAISLSSRWMRRCAPGSPRSAILGACRTAPAKWAFPRPPRPPSATTRRWPGLARSPISSPLSASVTTVPGGTGRTRSGPSRPLRSAPPPGRPSGAWNRRRSR